LLAQVGCYLLTLQNAGSPYHLLCWHGEWATFFFSFFSVLGQVG
jgi:hypothetical protein